MEQGRGEGVEEVRCGRRCGRTSEIMLCSRLSVFSNLNAHRILSQSCGIFAQVRMSERKG